MMSENYANRELHLNQIFENYRGACGAPEGAVNFMPNLWAKIEARQSKRLSFERVAKVLAGAAAALSLALGMFLAVPSQQPSAFFSGSYVEAIASEHASEFGTFSAPLRLELMNVENRVR